MDLLVNIDIDDLDRGIAFYTDAFGMTVGRMFGRDGAELLGGPVPIYLLVKAAGAKPAAGVETARHYGRHWTPVHLDFVVADVSTAVDRAVAAGATLEQPIRTSGWGAIASLSDPFGNGFCILQFLGAGYDAIATNGER